MSSPSRGEAWLMDPIAVTAAVTDAVRAGIRSPLAPYRVPRELLHQLTANQSRLLHFLCWAAHASADGSVLVDAKQVLVFSGLGSRCARTFRQLKGLTIGSSTTPLMTPVPSRKGERDDFRVRLNWLAEPAVPTALVPGGFLWHRWLALFPPQAIPFRVLGLLLESRTGTVPTGVIRAQCRRQYSDGAVAAGRIHPADRNNAIGFLTDIGVARRMRDERTATEHLQFLANVMRQAPNTERLLKKCASLVAIDYSASSVVHIGNPRAGYERDSPGLLDAPVTVPTTAAPALIGAPAGCVIPH